MIKYRRGPVPGWAAGASSERRPTGDPGMWSDRRKGRPAKVRAWKKGGERLRARAVVGGQGRAAQDEQRTQPRGPPGPAHLVTCFAAAQLPAARAPALMGLRAPTSPENLWRGLAPSHGVSGAVPVATQKASGTD